MPDPNDMDVWLRKAAEAAARADQQKKNHVLQHFGLSPMYQEQTPDGATRIFNDPSKVSPQMPPVPANFGGYDTPDKGLYGTETEPLGGATEDLSPTDDARERDETKQWVERENQGAPRKSPQRQAEDDADAAEVRRIRFETDGKRAIEKRDKGEWSLTQSEKDLLTEMGEPLESQAEIAARRTREADADPRKAAQSQALYYIMKKFKKRY